MMKTKKSLTRIECQKRLDQEIFCVHGFIITNYVWSKEDLMAKFEIEKNRLERLLIIIKSRYNLKIMKVGAVNNQSHFKLVNK